MAYEETAHADHQPHINSFAIFIALCVCTLISVAFDVIPMNRKLVAVAVMAVAVAKAQFVMRYFMHLKFEGRWKYVLLLPTVILACGLPLALAPDIAMHYYTLERDLTLTTDVGHHSGGHGEKPHKAATGDDGHAHDGEPHADEGGGSE